MFFNYRKEFMVVASTENMVNIMTNIKFWRGPFMVSGRKLGDELKVPCLRIKTDKNKWYIKFDAVYWFFHWGTFTIINL